MCTLVLMVRLSDGYVELSSLPSELREYWNARVQICPRKLHDNISWNCYMYYLGEKSPFRVRDAVSTTPAASSKKRRRRRAANIIAECCFSPCTRWTLKDYCWTENASVYEPQPVHEPRFTTTTTTTTTNTTTTNTTTTITTTNTNSTNTSNNTTTNTSPTTAATVIDANTKESTTPETTRIAKAPKTSNSTFYEKYLGSLYVWIWNGLKDRSLKS